MTQPLFDVMHLVGDRIAQAAHRLLCVSYDGTLTHFAAMPEGAALSPQMDRVLQSLAGHEALTLAIFSGRDRTDLQSRVNLPGVIYAGNHGLEISGPGQLFVEPGAAARTEALQALAASLTTQLELIEGVTVEFKGLTISVHFSPAGGEPLGGRAPRCPRRPGWRQLSLRADHRRAGFRDPAARGLEQGIRRELDPGAAQSAGQT